MVKPKFLDLYVDWMLRITLPYTTDDNVTHYEMKHEVFRYSAILYLVQYLVPFFFNEEICKNFSLHNIVVRTPKGTNHIKDINFDAKEVKFQIVSPLDKNEIFSIFSDFEMISGYEVEII